jgi:hypothetical protein
MWQKIIIGILVIAALAYLSRRIYRSLWKGDGGACANCPADELKNTVPK